MGELILTNLCRPALGVQFFETQCTRSWYQGSPKLEKTRPTTISSYPARFPTFRGILEPVWRRLDGVESEADEEDVGQDFP